MSSDADAKLKAALSITLFGIAVAAASTAYVLYLMAGAYPDRLWFGRAYWPAAVTFIVLLGVFAHRFVLLAGRLVRPGRE